MSLLIHAAGNTVGARVFLWILVSSLSWVCPLSASTSLDPVFSEADARISLAVLDGLFPGHGSLLVVEQETQPRKLQMDRVRAKLHGVSAEVLGQMIDNYLQRNKERASIPRLAIPEDAQFISPEEIEQLAAGEMGSWWKQFQHRFGAAATRVTLSLPGYSPSCDTALVFLTHSRGPLAGESSVVVLQKAASGSWKIVAQAQVAVW